MAQTPTSRLMTLPRTQRARVADEQVEGFGGRCFCSEEQYSIVRSGEYNRLGVHGYRFSIVKCAACDLARTTPQPDPYQYASGFSLTTRSGEFIGSTRDGWSAAVARDIARRGRGERLLDIGCHVGNLVEAACEIGFDAHGIDLDPLATARGRQLGRAIENRALEDVEETFDMVVLVHVLEHVHELRAFLSEFERVLDPGGLAFIYVPHYRGLIPRLMRDNWMGWFPAQHVWHFTPTTLVRTVEAATRLRIRDCTTRGVIEPPSTGVKGAGKSAISAFSRAVGWGDGIEAVFKNG
jgi:SAM-dependent methyltransferase